MSEAQDAANRDNADWGLTIERDVVDERPELEHVANDADEPDWYDARLVEDMTTGPDARVSDLLVATAGTPVEIKACQPTIVDGNSTRTGRWWIRRGAHEQLLKAGGLYALAVYDPNEADHLLRVAFLDARTIDCLVETWSTTGDGRQAARVRWNQVFDSLEDPR